jgi:hypothetical protein
MVLLLLAATTCMARRRMHHFSEENDSVDHLTNKHTSDRQTFGCDRGYCWMPCPLDDNESISGWCYVAYLGSGHKAFSGPYIGTCAIDSDCKVFISRHSRAQCVKTGTSTRYYVDGIPSAFSQARAASPPADYMYSSNGGCHAFQNKYVVSSVVRDGNCFN